MADFRPSAAFDRRSENAVRRAKQLIHGMASPHESAVAGFSLDTSRVTDPCVALAIAASVAGLRDADDNVLRSALGMLDGVSSELFDFDRQVTALVLAGIAGIPLGRRSALLMTSSRLAESHLERAAARLPFSWRSIESRSPARQLSPDADLVVADARSFARERLIARHDGRAQPFPVSSILVQDIDLLLLEDTQPVTIHATDPSEQLRRDIASAVALARPMANGVDFEDGAEGRVLTERGAESLARSAPQLSGLMRVTAYRDDLVLAALSALHDLLPGRDYAIADGAIIITSPPQMQNWPRTFQRTGIQPFLELKHDVPYSGALRVAASARLSRILAAQGTLAGVSATTHRAAGELRKHCAVAVSAMPDTYAPKRLPAATLLRTRAECDTRIVQAALAERQAGRSAILVAGRRELSEAIASALSQAGANCRIVPGRLSGEDHEALRVAAENAAILLVDKIGEFGEPFALREGRHAAVIFAEAYPGTYLQRQICDHLVARSSIGPILRFASLEDTLFDRMDFFGAIQRKLVGVLWPLAKGRFLLRRASKTALGADRRARAMQWAGERRMESMLSFAPLFPRALTTRRNAS
jgi:hypothetical protein